MKLMPNSTFYWGWFGQRFALAGMTARTVVFVMVTVSCPSNLAKTMLPMSRSGG